MEAGTLLPTPYGDVDYAVTGRADPTTVFGHGVGGSIEEARVLGSGVAGTKVFLHFRGHGASPEPAQAWTYAALAGQLRAVADAVGATRALGISMGAGALLRLLADTPDRFERAVFFLPAVLDQPRSAGAASRLNRLAAAVSAADAGEDLVALLAEDVPAALRARAPVRAWLRRQAQVLRSPGVAAALRAIPEQTAVADRAELSRVEIPCLVIGQEHDRAHPVQVARELAAALPRARLEIFAEGAALWLGRRRLRELVTGFFDGGSGAPSRA
jgi:pimeloyl-ACP methyl ester carboxylesterase